MKGRAQCHNIVISLLLFTLLYAVSANALPLESQEDYPDLDIHFDRPAELDLSAAGNPISGNLSMEGSCSHISVAWIRDPGIDPGSILETIKNAYNAGEVKTISSQRDEKVLAGFKASCMDLEYEFKEIKSKKRFWAWNSSSSDRLFLASFSTCRWENAEEMFDQTMVSFRDTAEKEPLKISSGMKDRLWSLLLGDLLSSYHYRDSQLLPPQSADVQAKHLLSPRNGTYQLDSSESISADPPRVAAVRAAAVLAILRREGYTARLVQRGGQIRLGVQEPSGKWRAVSVNPSRPDRAIGVLLEEPFQGLAYDSIEDWEEENGSDAGPIEEAKLVQKDCDPSRYVELNRPKEINSTWQQELQSILDSYEYPEKYQKDVFDCSDTAQICCELLESKGYDARLMMAWEEHPLGNHLWVVVSYPDQAGTNVTVETAITNGDQELIHLGKITAEDNYLKGIMYNSSKHFSRLHPEESILAE